jgi:hypothetical protein
MAERLFISHASEDEAVVGRIVAYLEANGTPCWLASRDIPAKSIYADEIAEAMESCSACAVILSAASNQSKAVKRELELASHYDKPFIPIRIDATEPGRGFDYYLRNAQWVDYRRDGERGLDRIVAHVGVDSKSSSPSVSADREVVLEIKREFQLLGIGLPIEIIWMGGGNARLWMGRTKRFRVTQPGILRAGSLQLGLHLSSYKDRLSGPIPFEVDAGMVRLRIKIKWGFFPKAILIWFENKSEPLSMTLGPVDEDLTRLGHVMTGWRSIR